MASAGVTIKWEDRGLDEFLAQLKSLDGRVVNVGYDDPGTATIAAYNEFGTIHIPARAFMRNGVKTSGRKLEEVAADEFGGVLEGDDIDLALLEIGEVVKDSILAMLDSTRSWAAPNAPSTIKKKGAEFPPLDAGHQRLHEDLAVWLGRAE